MTSSNDHLRMAARSQAYRTHVVEGPRRRVVVPVPFEPDDVWGAKPQHPVAGSVNGMPVRAVVERLGQGWGVVLGPAWRRDCGVAVGDVVDVLLAPEGPQRDDLAPDLAEALAASPSAAMFFDGLAPFYRRAYLRWIDATRARPDVRVERISEVVRLLEAGIRSVRRSDRCARDGRLNPGSWADPAGRRARRP